MIAASLYGSAAAAQVEYRRAMAEARAALRLIRETVETLGPVGAMASEEATNALRGLTLMAEAEEIVEGIKPDRHPAVVDSQGGRIASR